MAVDVVYVVCQISCRLAVRYHILSIGQRRHCFSYVLRHREYIGSALQFVLLLNDDPKTVCLTSRSLGKPPTIRLQP